jgi:hypothetical protein
MKFDEFKIKQLCDQYKIDNYTIVDGLVNVNGNVYLSSNRLTKLPIRFGTVTGVFDCANNKLTSLEGSPHTVYGNFDCDNNKLTSLIGSPREVGGYFSCGDNKLLISLEGAPELIGGGLYCNDTPIGSIFQSNDKGSIYMFNAIFIDSVDMEKIQYWFGLINKPLTDEILKQIKKYYPNI